MTLVLYDLVGRDDRRFSPHCWRTRMALAHKGLEHEARPTRFTEIQTIGNGQVIPGFGWVDTDYLGIDPGPIVTMIANHRNGLIWQTMRKNPHLRRGLQRAGFQGGWLAST